MSNTATNPGVITKFLLLVLLLTSPALSLAANPAIDENCRVKHYDQDATVQYIHDGDTLKLRDGRKVRLIGINTPELARDNKPAEAFAVAATDALKTMIQPGDMVHLRFGSDKKDHYGRLLAHVFAADGKNLQAEMLKKGMARVIFISPNTAFSNCYMAQERLARCQNTDNGIGIWQNNRILSARALKDRDTGFQLVSGTLQSMHINEKGIWLNIDNRLTIGIRPDNKQLFDVDQLTTMLHQPITVRGWLNKSDRNTPFYIRIRHPDALQLSSEYACQR